MAALPVGAVEPRGGEDLHLVQSGPRKAAGRTAAHSGPSWVLEPGARPDTEATQIFHSPRRKDLSQVHGHSAARW